MKFLKAVWEFVSFRRRPLNDNTGIGKPGKMIKSMDKEVNTIDACNYLNLEMDDDWKGASGEDTAKAILMSLPIFRVVFRDCRKLPKQV